MRSRAKFHRLSGRQLALVLAISLLTFGVTLGVQVGLAFADDGGWAECKNYNNYLECGGAVQALTLSVTTSAGTAVGIGSAIVLQGIIAGLAQGAQAASAGAALRPRQRAEPHSAENSARQQPSGWDVLFTEDWLAAVKANLHQLFLSFPALAGESIDILDLLDAVVEDANERLAPRQPGQSYHLGVMRAGYLELDDVRLVPGHRTFHVIGLDQLDRPLYGQYYLHPTGPGRGEVYAGDYWGSGQSPERIGYYQEDPEAQIIVIGRYLL